MMKYFFKIILALYLFVGAVPIMGALDKVVTQWLYLNLINSIVLGVFLFKNLTLKKYILNKSSLLFISFFSWASISISVSINKIESLVVLSQIFALTISFIISLVCISRIENPFTYISNVISTFLIFELISVYLPFFNSNLDLNLIFQRSSQFLGFAANVNITAFSLLYKIPFLIYSIFYLRNVKLIFALPLCFIIFLLIFIASGTFNSTRAAILTFTILAPILLIFSTIIYYRFKKSYLFKISLTYLFTLIISFFLNSFVSDLLGKSDKNISNRVSSLTALVDEEKQKDGSLTQRINFYSQAFNFIVENPLLGTGIGNWKIKSIDTNKDRIIGYMVPYHVHNDYLELAAETGLIGLLLYLTILFLGFKDVIMKIFNILMDKKNFNKDSLIWIMLFNYLIIFLIDSNLNFPFARPIVIINLIVVLAYLANNKKIVYNEY